ncbi:MAG: hypothetical protein A3E54_02250 [Gammaproteobacteria bacterium RIFCSPHIGHO2_12_FULL_41_25]|nr:MAG: hypothetical protein A3B71_02225 [Gammaproteobacteria bacterium RIFCSPHIGHO2_02_FULL_42_43]OGT29006.1 MAG: hypothetical protein A2624_00175 [Gammaproteobacteria bacterium RIFCSPHIGHO2_01_FULL_42_8]OGT53502.1 MAG: hypothetical protein A3E54_02250 [Gammaproteobacteria bacterium RIFCSPHIGHO2_12_FULL_41_25]OGT86488.1 MAG: hypothetical protein A3G86_02530 [Gammaproteobacteria bacterium RIFCSPLOWO2_12_FULL_42_18]
MARVVLIQKSTQLQNTVLTKHPVSLSCIFWNVQDEGVFMHYWRSIASEVLTKNAAVHACVFTNRGRMSDFLEAVLPPPRRIIRGTHRENSYYLGEDFPGIYLTKREAQCIFWLAQGLTIPEVGVKMDLSARTVEFYVKNMKLKLNCISKKELVDTVLQTTLLQQLESEGMRIARH